MGVLLLVLVSHAVLAWLSREPGILTREDDAEYIVLAQSLQDFGYHESFRVGIREIPLICEEIALAREWSENFVHDYLTRRIQYRMTDQHQAGLQLFHQLCVENFLAPLREEVGAQIRAVETVQSPA